MATEQSAHLDPSVIPEVALLGPDPFEIQSKGRNPTEQGRLQDARDARHILWLEMHGLVPDETTWLDRRLRREIPSIHADYLPNGENKKHPATQIRTSAGRLAASGSVRLYTQRRRLFSAGPPVDEQLDLMYHDAEKPQVRAETDEEDVHIWARDRNGHMRLLSPQVFEEIYPPEYQLHIIGGLMANVKEIQKARRAEAEQGQHSSRISARSRRAQAQHVASASGQRVDSTSGETGSSEAGAAGTDDDSQIRLLPGPGRASETGGNPDVLEGGRQEPRQDLLGPDRRPGDAPGFRTGDRPFGQEPA